MLSILRLSLAAIELKKKRPVLFVVNQNKKHRKLFFFLEKNSFLVSRFYRKIQFDRFKKKIAHFFTKVRKGRWFSYTCCHSAMD